VGAAGATSAGNRAAFNVPNDVDNRRFGALLVRSLDLTDVGAFVSCAAVLAAGFADDDAVFLVNGQPTVCAP
jgi:hypothetical protein